MPFSRVARRTGRVFCQLSRFTYLCKCAVLRRTQFALYLELLGVVIFLVLTLLYYFCTVDVRMRRLPVKVSAHVPCSASHVVSIDQSVAVAVAVSVLQSSVRLLNLPRGFPFRAVKKADLCFVVLISSVYTMMSIHSYVLCGLL